MAFTNEEYFKSNYGNLEDYAAIEVWDKSRKDTVYGLDTQNEDEHNALLTNQNNVDQVEMDMNYDEYEECMKDMQLTQRLVFHLKLFCRTTSAHGIPWIFTARNVVWRFLWLALYCVCFGMYWWQIINVVSKFNRNEKIVDIELKFETSPFPAITLCNLNPYKSTVSHASKSVGKTLRDYKDAIHASKKKSHGNKVPGLSGCSCTQASREIASEECQVDVTVDPNLTEGDVCLCSYDQDTQEISACYLREMNVWTLDDCSTCKDLGMCSMEENIVDCLCALLSKHHSNLCILDETPINLHLQSIETTRFIGYKCFLERLPEFQILVAMSEYLQPVDNIAIATKARDNMIYAMTALDDDLRREVSYTQNELIHKCSFNGKQCDLLRDLREHLDPVFGACYTYNFNTSRVLTSSRAGPMYGLRMLLNVNASEYLSMTEATGIRLTISANEEYPFPDTFGYGAPTGFVSSFGVKRKRVERLAPPFGTCLTQDQVEDFIYDGYAYTIEVKVLLYWPNFNVRLIQGCYRSCFQQTVMRKCGCGDPRYPLGKSKLKKCNTLDPVARSCLEGVEGHVECECQQPCRQSLFSVSYSASLFPSASFKSSECTKSHEECLEHYQKHGVMIEVFYEQLAYENFREAQAYGFVNLLADFGGQLGLWLGVSVITVFEFLLLLFHFVWITINKTWQDYSINKLTHKQKQ